MSVDIEPSAEDIAKVSNDLLKHIVHFVGDVDHGLQTSTLQTDLPLRNEARETIAWKQVNIRHFKNSPEFDILQCHPAWRIARNELFNAMHNFKETCAKVPSSKEKNVTRLFDRNIAVDFVDVAMPELSKAQFRSNCLARILLSIN